MRAVLVRVLVLALLPVLIITTPAVSQAAVKVSGATAGNFTWDDGFMPGRWFSCTFQAFYKVTDVPDNSTNDVLYLQTIGVNSGDCDTGTGFNVEGGSVSLTFNGQQPDGATCTASGAAFIDSAENETFPPFSATVTGLTPHPAEQLCQVTEYCWSVDVPNWGADFNATGCEAFSMGPPALPEGGSLAGCDLVTTDSTTDLFVPQSITWRKYMYNASTEVWVPKLTLAQPAPRDGRFGFHYYHHPTYQRLGGYFTFSAGQTVAEYDGLWGAPSGSTRAPGFQLWSTGFPSGSSPVYGYDGADAPAGDFGRTLPAQCMYYFGEKFWDDPGSNEDTPAGTVDGPVSGGDDPDPDPVATPPSTPTEDEGCSEGFSLWSPASWVSAGFCEVVSALSTIARAIGSLGRAIAGIAAAILAGLLDLLVPDKWSMTPLTEDMRQAYDDSNAGAWTDLAHPPNAAPAEQSAQSAQSRMAPSSEPVLGVMTVSSSSCQGPGFTWDMFAEMGMEPTIYPFAACEGITAELAGWTRLISGLMLAVFGVLKCVTLLLTSVGAMRNAEITRGFDWSEATFYGPNYGR